MSEKCLHFCSDYTGWGSFKTNHLLIAVWQRQSVAQITEARLPDCCLQLVYIVTAWGKPGVSLSTYPDHTI